MLEGLKKNHLVEKKDVLGHGQLIISYLDTCLVPYLELDDVPRYNLYGYNYCVEKNDNYNHESKDVEYANCLGFRLCKLDLGLVYTKHAQFSCVLTLAFKCQGMRFVIFQFHLLVIAVCRKLRNSTYSRQA